MTQASHVNLRTVSDMRIFTLNVLLCPNIHFGSGVMETGKLMCREFLYSLHILYLLLHDADVKHSWAQAGYLQQPSCACRHIPDLIQQLKALCSFGCCSACCLVSNTRTNTLDTHSLCRVSVCMGVCSCLHCVSMTRLCADSCLEFVFWMNSRRMFIQRERLQMKLSGRHGDSGVYHITSRQRVTDVGGGKWNKVNSSFSWSQ